MHFSKLLSIASTLLLVLGSATAHNYPLAAIDLKVHEDCEIGLKPADGSEFSIGTLAAPDICGEIPIEHIWKIKRYSFDAWTISPNTVEDCHGAAIFNNAGCRGSPFYVLPFEYGHRSDWGVCLADKLGYFVSVKLICEPGKVYHRPKWLNVTDGSGS